MTEMRNEAGFTLVELAATILVIGILIVGILRGMEVVDNAKVVSTINQITEIEGASMIFQTKYRAMPGDIKNPIDRVPGCTEAPCNVSGDEDGYIDLSSDTIDNLLWGSAGHESRNYWLHLSVSGLLRNIQDYYQGTPNKFGVDFPKTPMGGGWLVQSFRDGSRRQTYLTPVAGMLPLNDANSRLLTPARAHQIDLKMDDGLANRGKVRGYLDVTNGTCTVAGSTDQDRNAYLIDEGVAPECNLMIIMTRSMIQ